MKRPSAMNRRTFLLATVALAVAQPARADFVDAVRQQLRRQGYRQVSVTSTLLGRSKIVATGKKGTREIILNPKTGEVLRDLWTSSAGNIAPSIVGDDHQTTTGDESGDDDSGDDGDSGDDSGDDGGDDNDSGDDGGDDNDGGDDKGGDGDSGGSGEDD